MLNRDLPKRGDTLNDFMRRATWRKGKAQPFVFTKHKHQYPHIYALQQCAGSRTSSRQKDAISMVEEMLDSFPCGIIKRTIGDVFQVFYGKELQGHNLQQYFDTLLQSARLHSYFKDPFEKKRVPVVEDVYIAPIRLQQCMPCHLSCFAMSV